MGIVASANSRISKMIDVRFIVITNYYYFIMYCYNRCYFSNFMLSSLIDSFDASAKEIAPLFSVKEEENILSEIPIFERIS